MKITPPQFTEGKDFQRMAVRESGGVYRFKLLRDAVFIFDELVVTPPVRLSFQVHGKEWMRIEPHRITISKFYSWNGNSPKKGVRILGMDHWMGTPDFIPGTLTASLIHDSLFQFSFLRKMPFSCEHANEVYEQVCKANHFKLAGVYRSALDEFSHEYWGKYQPHTTCHEI